MGRTKGQTFRKMKLKKIQRIRCRGWTIREDVLEKLTAISEKLGVCESRIVEVAINKMLMQDNKILIDNSKIFT